MKNRNVFDSTLHPLNLNMALISNFVIFSLTICLLYFIGLLTFITDYEDNKCEMTYMFEYPQFVKIGVPKAEKYQRYGLYAYSEGRFTEKARSSKFDGIPVLFIPGNGGSYKQVRSLASVALRKAVNSRSKYHFDFFTVDLNDELSGLNGALLNEQTIFVNESIHRILELYQSDEPESVVLIGHSMGGVIAHSIALNNDNVNLLITLASPHRKPSLCLDHHMKQYYDNLQEKIKTTSMGNKTFISIGGGNFDHLVHSWLTNADSSSLNVVTTAIPTVWLSTDHQCIVWCKQLVLAVIRALFDAVDMNEKQISTDHRLRLAAFKYHLLTNSGINLQQAAKYKTEVRFDPQGEWHEDLRRQYSILVKNRKTIQYIMIRYVDDPKYQITHIRADNLFYPDWVYTCSANVIQGASRICEKGYHLSHRSELVPILTSVQNRPKFFQIDMFKLKKRYPEISHVLIKVLPQPEPALLHFDLHNTIERTLQIDLPNWYSLGRKYIMKETPKKHMRYVLELPGLQHLIQTYLLYVEPIHCESIKSHASVKFYVPWAHHDTYSFITEISKKPLLLRLFNSKPSSAKNSTAKVILNLDPTCQYTVSVRNSFVGMLAQLARYYSTMLLSNIAAVLLITHYSQMNSLHEKGHCVIFQAALSVDTKPYYLVTAAKLISRFLVMGRFADILPKPDGQYLLEENVDFLLLPLFLYLTAVGITYLISVILWAVLILSESTVHRLAAKGVTKTFGGAVKLSDWFLNALHKVPCIVALILFSVGLSTCGGMALALGTVYYFLKLTQMGQEYVEGLVYKILGKVTSRVVKIFSRGKKPEDTKPDTVEETPRIAQEEPKPESSITQKEEKKEEKVEKSSDKEDNGDNHWEDIEMIENKEIEEMFEKENEEVEEKEKEKTETKEILNDDKIVDNETAGTSQGGSDEGEEMQLVKFENANEETTETNNPPNEEREKKKSVHDSIHFHFTMFLLWFLVMMINIPSVLTWARNFHYSNVLSPDPSMIPGVVLSTCAIFLWQMEIPKRNKLYYKELGSFLYMTAVICLIYTPIHIYRLTYILTMVICVVTLHQLFAPEQTEESTSTEEQDDLLTEKDPVERIGEIKSKME